MDRALLEDKLFGIKNDLKVQHASVVSEDVEIDNTDEEKQYSPLS
jgi:hypothetical protein